MNTTEDLCPENIRRVYFRKREKERESARARKQDCRGSGVFAWVSMNLEWLTGSAVAVSLRVNATLCLSFRTPTASSWQLGMGSEKARNKLKMWEKEGIG